MAFGRKGRKTKTGGTRGSNQYGPRGVSTQDQEAAERESAHAAQAAQGAASGAQGLAVDIVEEPVVEPQEISADEQRLRSIVEEKQRQRSEQQEAFERQRQQRKEDRYREALENSEKLVEHLPVVGGRVSDAAEKDFGSGLRGKVEMDPDSLVIGEPRYDGYGDHYVESILKGTVTFGEGASALTLEVEHRELHGLEDIQTHNEKSFPVHTETDFYITEKSTGDSGNEVKRTLVESSEDLLAAWEKSRKTESMVSQ